MSLHQNGVIAGLLAIFICHIAAGARGAIVIQGGDVGVQRTGSVVDPTVGGGLDQVGLLVTVQYTTFTETRTWTADGGSSAVKGGTKSALFTDGWELFADVDGSSEGTFGDSDETLSGNSVLDTLNERWQFKHDLGKLPGGSVLQSITLNGLAANIVFDRPVLNGVLIATPYNPTPEEGSDGNSPFVGNSDEFGTATSTRGRDFFSPELAQWTQTVSASYSNQVGTFGDLFTTASIVFPTSQPGFSSFSFAIDTDKTGTLAVVTSVVPETSAFLLAGLAGGVAGLVSWVRRTPKTRD